MSGVTQGGVVPCIFPQTTPVSLCEGMDTTSVNGKLIFHIFAALAEFERDLIR